VEKAIRCAQVVRFATFALDLQEGEVRKAGLKLKLSGQPFQVLAILLEHSGAIVTREEFQKRLWRDTFVDVDHNLNTAINKIRGALVDSAENPRFVPGHCTLLLQLWILSGFYSHPPRWTITEVTATYEHKYLQHSFVGLRTSATPAWPRTPGD